MRRIYSLIFLLVFLEGCTTPIKVIGTPAPTRATRVNTPSATAPIAPPPETLVAPTLVPDPTATSETRLPAERWQDWPIIPAVTKRAIEIYQSGRNMGLDGHAFSKVGDCQSVRAAFMGYFDIPERFSLGNDYAYLQQTVDNFAGHFNSDGQAVKGGFNAAAVLSPLWADPNVCLAGENPLECELRVTKPIIVIVSLEVWWDGRTASQYEGLMRRILDTIIAHGAVPILATKADNVEGDYSLNLTTARLATDYDLPLWNFWAAVQPLPDHGMDTNRKDGFHISTDAWSTRSFTGLEALDSVWRGLVKTASESVQTQTLSLTATPGTIATSVETPAPSGTLKAGATPPGSLGWIVFGLSERQGAGYSYRGVYLLDPATQMTRQVFGSGVRFQSASPDGKYLLVSEGSSLYRTGVDGMDPLRLTDSLYAYGNSDAVWLPDGQIAAVLVKNQVNGITILSAEGEVVGQMPVPNATPVEIYPGSNRSHVYWESGSCSAPGVCQKSGAWVTSLDGNVNQELKGLAAPLISPDDGFLASGDASANAQNILIFSTADGRAPRPYPLPGNLLVNYAWSPAGDELIVVLAMRSDYSGKVLGNRNFLISPQTLAIIEYPQSNMLNPRALWAPDGAHLFWIGTLPSDNGFKIAGSLVSRSSKQVNDLGNIIGQTSKDYLAVTNADWLALP